MSFNYLYNVLLLQYSYSYCKLCFQYIFKSLFDHDCEWVVGGDVLIPSFPSRYRSLNLSIGRYRVYTDSASSIVTTKSTCSYGWVRLQCHHNHWLLFFFRTRSITFIIYNYNNTFLFLYQLHRLYSCIGSVLKRHLISSLLSGARGPWAGGGPHRGPAEGSVAGGLDLGQDAGLTV